MVVPHPPELVEALLDGRVHPSARDYISLTLPGSALERRFGRTTGGRLIKCDVNKDERTVVHMAVWTDASWIDITAQGWLDDERWESMPQADLLDLLLNALGGNAPIGAGGTAAVPPPAAAEDAQQDGVRSPLYIRLLQFRAEAAALARDMASAGARGAVRSGVKASLPFVDKAMHTAGGMLINANRAALQRSVDVCSLLDGQLCSPEMASSLVSRLPFHLAGTSNGLHSLLQVFSWTSRIGMVALEKVAAVSSRFHLTSVSPLLMSAVTTVFGKDRSLKSFVKNLVPLLTTPMMVRLVVLVLCVAFPPGAGVLASWYAEMALGFGAAWLTGKAVQLCDEHLTRLYHALKPLISATLNDTQQAEIIREVVMITAE